MVRKRMAKVIEKPRFKQLGIKVEVHLWREFKHLALDKETTATELMADAMRQYLEKEKS